MRRAILLLLLLPLPSVPGWGEEVPRVLFLSKSSTFEHSAIAWRDGNASHVDRVLQGVAERHGFELISTKDAGQIRADRLREIDAVVFYTTGDLTEPGSGTGLFGGDGHPAMGESGVEDLIGWVEEGGAFLGFHSASDTFHDSSKAPSPYIELLGGEFLTHGRQFEGTLEVVDPEHPTVRKLPRRWTVMDEWYVFKNLNRDRIHVVALLDTSTERERQQAYDRPSYPVIWCSTRGDGRVFFNAMGHREDVWDREVFQEAFVDALHWALGRSEALADPNFDAVVPQSEE